MQKREKQLLGVVVVVGALAGGYYLYGSVMGAITRRQNEISRLEGELNSKKTQITMGRKADAKLKLWQQHSLPSDFEKARSLYSAWLRNLVQESGLGEPNVGPISSSAVFLKSNTRASRSTQRKVVYQRMPYSVSGTAGHGELIKFLYEFYSSGHMHLIRSLTLTPAKDGKFDVKMVTFLSL